MSDFLGVGRFRRPQDILWAEARPFRLRQHENLVPALHDKQDVLESRRASLRLHRWGRLSVGRISEAVHPHVQQHDGASWLRDWCFLMLISLPPRALMPREVRASELKLGVHFSVFFLESLYE